MKTKTLTVGVVGIANIPMKPDASEFTDVAAIEQYETRILSSIQDIFRSQGIIFEGRVDAVSNESFPINEESEDVLPENANTGLLQNTEAINDAGNGNSHTTTGSNSKKSRKYPRTGPKMHWKTREKMERLARQDKRKKKR